MLQWNNDSRQQYVNICSRVSCDAVHSLWLAPSSGHCANTNREHGLVFTRWSLLLQDETQRRSISQHNEMNPYTNTVMTVCWWADWGGVPEMAICWILNWMLMVGFSSGLEAPACRLMVPFRLGSFCGLILPTSHVNNWPKQKTSRWQGEKPYMRLRHPRGDNTKWKQQAAFCFIIRLRWCAFTKETSSHNF